MTKLLKMKCILFSFSIYFTAQLVFAQSSKIELKLGVHPLYTPQKVFSIFSPLCEFITQKSKNIVCKIETTKDYAHYNSRIKEKYFDILMPNPYQTLKALNYDYKLAAKWGDDELFKGLILVRKDSNIKKLKDLKDKKISFPAPTAVASSMMPQHELAKSGLLPHRDYVPVYSGSQESSILSVFNKSTSAGATWYPPWNRIIKDKPELFNELEILSESPSLPNNSVMMKKSVSKKIQKEITQILIDLDKSDEGKKILSEIGISHFEVAKESTYAPAKKFIDKFQKEIGEIPW